MLAILCLILFATSINGQIHLESMNRCLGNCATCRNNDLTGCSGREMRECIKGYNGTNCSLKGSYAGQVVLMDAFKPAVPLNMWQNSTIFQCSYTNSKLQKINVNTLGMYTKSRSNKFTIPIQPNYQNYILSFNLIRDSWTPFSDSLRIVVMDEFQVELKDYFIEFPSRNEINPDVNLLRCNGTPRIIEKFQIQDSIDPVQHRKLNIKFQGDIFSTSDWGLTNVKIAIGCSKFLNYDGQDCNKCSDGFFYNLDLDNKVIGCQPCPFNCTKCQSNHQCQACSQGFTLQEGKCTNTNALQTFPAPNSTLLCQDNHTMLLSRTVLQQQKLKFQLSSLPNHKKLRLIFNLAYTGQNVQSTATVVISIDGIKQAEVAGSKLKGTQSQLRSSCTGFGDRGYYSLYRVVTPYMEHNGSKIQVTVVGNPLNKLGVQEIGVQYEPVVPDPSENETKNDSLPIPSNNTNKTSEQSTPATPTNNTTQNNPSNQTNKSNLVDNDRLPVNNTITSTTNSTQNTQKLQPNQTNNTNNTNNNTNTNNKTIDNSSQANNSGLIQAGLSQVIKKIEEVNGQVKLGLRLDRELIITVLYPFAMDKFPFLIANLQNKNFTLVPKPEKQSKQYQQFALNLQQSLLNQKLTLTMSDQIPLLSNQPRFLQSQSPPKSPIFSTLGQLQINRYDYLGQNQWESIIRYSTYFEILAWATIIGTIVLSFFGNSIITQKCSLLLQIVFLHVYVYSEYLPVNFKNTIAGLQRMENLDYFTTPIATAIQKLLLGNVVQHSPPIFTTFNKDINFTRMVYPCILISILYLLWFVLLTIARKLIQPNLVVTDLQQQRTYGQKLKLFLIRTSERYLNFWYQVWQYQYLVYIWAACLQFHNMAYPIGSDRSQVANMIFCFGVLVAMVALPIGTLVYLNKRYFRLDYFQYSYWYQNLFYLRLPEQSLPSNHHRIFIVIRNIRYILIAICLGYLPSYPIQCLTILILTHFSSLLYLKLTHLQLHPFNSILNILQHLLLIALEITLIISYGTSTVFTTQQYMIVGHVLTTCCLLTSGIGLVRVGYYGWMKLEGRVMEKEVSQFKPAIGTERVV